MSFAATVPERAYQLAKSGIFAEVADIVAKLSEEGYFHVKEHLANGTSLRRELKSICQKSSAPRSKARA